jgi:uncharacterized membrane protein YozB (DUF420 family)
MGDVYPIRVRGTSVRRELKVISSILGCDVLGMIPLLSRADALIPLISAAMAVILCFAPKYVILGWARTIRRHNVNRRPIAAYGWLVLLDVLVLLYMWTAFPTHAADDLDYIPLVAIECVWAVVGALLGAVAASVVLVTSSYRPSR